MFGKGRPSSNFANAALIVVGVAAVSWMQSCNVRRNDKQDVILAEVRSHTGTINEVITGAPSRYKAADVKRDEMIRLLREIESRMPATRPATQP